MGDGRRAEPCSAAFGRMYRERLSQAWLGSTSPPEKDPRRQQRGSFFGVRASRRVGTSARRAEPCSAAFGRMCHERLSRAWLGSTSQPGKDPRWQQCGSFLRVRATRWVGTYPCRAEPCSAAFGLIYRERLSRAWLGSTLQPGKDPRRQQCGGFFRVRATRWVGTYARRAEPCSAAFGRMYREHRSRAWLGSTSQPGKDPRWQQRGSFLRVRTSRRVGTYPCRAELCSAAFGRMYREHRSRAWLGSTSRPGKDRRWQQRGSFWGFVPADGVGTDACRAEPCSAAFGLMYRERRSRAWLGSTSPPGIDPRWQQCRSFLRVRASRRVGTYPRRAEPCSAAFGPMYRERRSRAWLGSTSPPKKDPRWQQRGVFLRVRASRRVGTYALRAPRYPRSRPAPGPT